MQLRRLQGRKVNSAVQRKGRLWKGKTMIIRWLPGTPPSHGRTTPCPPGIYMGTYASTALDSSAVRRNRMRRRCREALRLTVASTKKLSSVQLLATPQRASLEAPFEMLLRDAEAFFSLLP